MAPMQGLLLRFAGSLPRHRRLVLAGWAIVLVAALPFAARQSDRLTGGGFAVPGSRAEAVQNTLEQDFDAAQRAKLGVVLIARGGAGAADQRAALERLRRAAARLDHVAVADAALDRAARGGAHTVVVPLRVDVNEWQAIDVAAHLRKALGIGTPL